MLVEAEGPLWRPKWRPSEASGRGRRRLYPSSAPKPRLSRFCAVNVDACN